MTYHLDEKLCRLRVRRRSALVNKTLREAGLGHDYGISVVQIERADSQNGHAHTRFGEALEHLSDTFGMRQVEPVDLVPGPNTIIISSL